MGKPAGFSKAEWRELVRAVKNGTSTTLVAASSPAKRRGIRAIQKARRG